MVACGAILILIGGGLAYMLTYAPPKALENFIAPPKPKPKIYYSPLTGTKVKDEAATKQPVTAIMLENSPEARPQSGLKAAGVVYEAIAEGGITRFLALYQQDKPQLIGPVRSLRMYYLDWAAPYDASIAHVGGSAAALSEVRNGSYRDIDQFFNAGTYWRASDRYAPHNVYTSFKNIDALNKSKGYKESKFTGFARADGKTSAKPNAKEITLNISGPAFNVSYKYDKAKNRYNRFLAGEPHNDRESGQITADVVVALKVDMKNVMEDGYRESITTTGSGKAVVFQNGSATEVTWKKDGRKGQLKFSRDNKEFKLIRGKTWISAIPNGSGSVSWQ